MLIMDNNCLKLLFYLIFLLSSFGQFINGNSVAVKQVVAKTLLNSTTPNKIYKKILKMRTLPFEDCGSTYDVLHLNVSSCSSIPCQMKRNTKVLVNVIFDDYDKNTKYLKHHVTWIFNAIRSDALITPDPCDGDHQCLKSNSDGKTYFSTVYVNKQLACMRGKMLWEAFDEHGTKALCFRIPIVIIP